MKNHLVICVLILLMGGLGGTINYLLNNESREKNKFFNDKYFWSCFIIGIGASILVPLFLNTISSNLINESANDPNKLYIIAGFFLLAAIYSKKFINSIWDRVTKQVNENTQQIRAINKETQPIIEKETEDDFLGKEIFTTISDERRLAYSKNNVNDEFKILNNIINGNYTFRSIKGISEEININESTVIKIIEELIRKDYIGIRDGKDGVKYYITQKGRRYYKSELMKVISWNENKKD
ncbi:YEATS-associated helix-containing protein [Oceanirhabdus seepicola]|uniref:YEATS-Like-Associating Three TM domain-containing protein n=1 Tax=Oceanirhabdus seepicola TaxID=2828781 RepID=A0A9J6PDG3_9CLOT|nr:YEATS-associated helix-containing protein [Oceanirhabdus seepicola]MCM1992805.1 hypothetical protein [Oceanirhabdus seepicola]